jgi:hypothetical protein
MIPKRQEKSMSPKNRFSRRPWIAALIFVMVAGFAVLASGQQRGRMADSADNMHVRILSSGPQGPEEFRGFPDDWTHYHLVFSNPGTAADAQAQGRFEQWRRIVNDPRYQMQQMKRSSGAKTLVDTRTADTNGLAGPMTDREAKELKKKGQMTKDWSEGVNAGTINPNTYPAKWSFSYGTASCADDFVIYPTGVAGSTTQASIIAYYNIYSGCTSPVPEVDWAYNTGGAVSLSPVFSFTGSQVAFIQTSSSVASLVLLTYPITPPDTGTLGGPIAPTLAGSASAYYNGGAGCTAPCMYKMALNGNPNDTWSSPYYDFSSDSLYVGDSAGKLHKFNPVFNGALAEVTTSWPVQLKHGTTNDTNQTTAPVYDPASGKVFVGTTGTGSGSTGGYLYSVGTGNQSTTSGTIYGASAQLDTWWGIRDAVLVDSTAATVYAFVGYDASHDSGVYQFSTGFTSADIKEVETGTGSDSTDLAYMMAGTFDNTYYTSPSGTSPSGYLYMGTTDASGPLYQITITSNAMGTATNEGNMSTSAYYGRFSPITEFYNANALYTAATAATATGTFSGTGTPSGTITIENSVTGNTLSLSPGASNACSSATSGTYSASSSHSTDASHVAAAINSATCQTTYSIGFTATYSGSGDSFTITQGTTGATPTFTLGGTSSHFGWSAVTPGTNATYTAEDLIFFGILAGSQSGCTSSDSDGCVISYNVTTPGTIAFLGGLNESASSSAFLAPTGGIIVDNSVGAGTLAGASQVYFLTTDSAAASCTTSGSGICAVQVSQSAP